MQSGDTLWGLKANNPIFQSKKKGIASLLDYIEQFSPCTDEVTVFDRVVGNAAALLLERIRGRTWLYGRVPWLPGRDRGWNV